ncbi:hypothetical protein BG46_01280 [Brucella anthropi]|uniref:hypothetical protein n=1 Tax=Brucella anthropi TaxID=529 RepID=UPI0004505E2B|nr:hypothetical protein [Brucella anthropi]EXL08566.1 hypothetical protein BG46_01280 [Brucella anthropi]
MPTAFCFGIGFQSTLYGSNDGFCLQSRNTFASLTIGEFKPFERSPFALAKINGVDKLVDQFG